MGDHTGSINMKLMDLLTDVANGLNIEWTKCEDGDWSLHNTDEVKFDDDNPAITIDQVVIVACQIPHKTLRGSTWVDGLAVFTVDCWEDYGQPRYDFELQSTFRYYTEALGEAARINTTFHAGQVWTHNDQEDENGHA